MTPDFRRRLGAITALVLGLFLGLTLVPGGFTGPFGASIGQMLKVGLGIGALGFPLIGLGVGLAGFDRLPRLDMKRAGVLVGALSLLVPCLVGLLLIAERPDHDLPRAMAETSIAARAVGVIPGAIAHTLYSQIGVAGGLLVWFLALSAVTLLTFAWHPLQHLERSAEPAAEPVEEAEAATERPRRAKKPTLLAALTDPEPAEAQTGKAEGAKENGRKGRKTPGARKPAVTAVPDREAVWTVDLLEPPKLRSVDAGEAELNALQERLAATLSEFKVEGDIAGRTTGPVVTQYGVRLRPGVKMNRLVALADDLALKMAARSIRVARIPGRDMVGVEVPNPKARVVVLRELLEAAAWDGEERLLPVALGLDLEGQAIVADLARMPHLLIAGATGTGKSVGINAIITSLIYRYQHKEDLRFLMIDPKMVELSMYKDLPHLRHPVVTNNKEAAKVLKWAVAEMDRRYVLLEANGARNLADFNRKVIDGKPLRNPGPRRVTLTEISAEESNAVASAPVEEPYTGGRLPLIVIIVDELADLMMTVQAEVETPLARLAQKARAIGIHLILATQRPSVNVITGLIKANFPSRVAFRVASKVDSRTILDANGAEALLGKGDMLFLEPGKSEPVRLQGAYISTEETEAIMEMYRARKAQLEREGMVDATESDILTEVPDDGEGAGAAAAGGEAGDRDERLREAAEVCIQNQGGSTSLLQRKLGVGYGRAARIIDQLEDVGILGPPHGSKPREVRIGFDQLDEYVP
jgi:S-DNA-T family DNA segregation ATPase FtsK/SpoIIIE